MNYLEYSKVFKGEKDVKSRTPNLNKLKSKIDNYNFIPLEKTISDIYKNLNK